MLYRTAKRIVVFTVGMSVVIVGVVMIIAPGPAFIVIPAGLAILATEFVWAKRLLNRLKATAGDVAARVTGKAPKPDNAASPTPDL